MYLPKFLRRNKQSIDHRVALTTDDILNGTLLPDTPSTAVLPAWPPKPKSKGRVIKQTRHSEFNPNPPIRGGRVVKIMPRNLQKIKQAQEKFEDDEGPSVEDLED